MGEEVRSPFPGAQVQSLVTACSSGSLEGSRWFLSDLWGHPTVLDWIGPTTRGPATCFSPVTTLPPTTDRQRGPTVGGTGPGTGFTAGS